MDKDQALKLARESSAKLNADPDLLELMASKVWNGAIDSSIKSLDEYRRTIRTQMSYDRRFNSKEGDEIKDLLDQIFSACRELLLRKK